VELCLNSGDETLSLISPDVRQIVHEATDSFIDRELKDLKSFAQIEV